MSLRNLSACLLVIGLAALVASAQTTPGYFQGFETVTGGTTLGGFPPSGGNPAGGAPQPADWFFVNNTSGVTGTTWNVRNTYAGIRPMDNALALMVGDQSGNDDLANTCDNWALTPVMTVKAGETLRFWVRAHNSGNGFSWNGQELGVYYCADASSTNTGVKNATVTDSTVYDDAFLSTVLANRGDYTNEIMRVNPYQLGGLGARVSHSPLPPTVDLSQPGTPENLGSTNMTTFSAAWTMYQYTFPAGTNFTGRIGFRYLCLDGGPGGAASDAIAIDDMTVGFPGDSNLDGKVSFADYIALANNFGTSFQTLNNNTTGPTWQQGDFNGDGKVSFADYILLANNFGQSVPEPMTLGLLAIGGLAMIRRNRK